MAEYGMGIKGLKELLLKLDKVKAGKFLRHLLTSLALEIEGKVARYPSQAPPKHQNRWYQRGYGSRYRRKDGTVTGRATSEQLGQMWYVKAESFAVRIGNRVSYAPFVQGAEHQAEIHKQHGWTTLEGEAEAALPELERRTQAVVDRMLAE